MSKSCSTSYTALHPMHAHMDESCCGFTNQHQCPFWRRACEHMAFAVHLEAACCLHGQALLCSETQDIHMITYKLRSVKANTGFPLNCMYVLPTFNYASPVSVHDPDHSHEAVRLNILFAENFHSLPRPTWHAAIQYATHCFSFSLP